MEENVIQINVGIMINVNASVKNSKNVHVCSKHYVWNLATCNYENGKHLASIMDDSAITCDKIT